MTDQAIGVLVCLHQLNPADGFTVLRVTSRLANTKLHTDAEAVITWAHNPCPHPSKKPSTRPSRHSRARHSRELIPPPARKGEPDPPSAPTGSVLADRTGLAGAAGVLRVCALTATSAMGADALEGGQGAA
ncbi:ANTAR domain-containing protein [Streptomyces collinus]|uniref:ANTAR domain-containing protein n=1 Tax=Streptomyces collinus TaxID=42684 RepID=UPI0034454B1D